MIKLSDYLKSLDQMIVDKKIHDDVDILHATVNLQDADQNTVTFYNLKNDQKAQELFQSRVDNYHGGLLVLTNTPSNNLNHSYIVVDTDNFSKVKKIICDSLYPLDESKKLIGVTGTNGKTTTTILAAQIAKQNGLSSLVIGSLGVRDEDKQLINLNGMTTPDYIFVRKYIHDFMKDRDICFMEVSSHALTQDRVFEIKYDLGAWLSFGQDHLDYHVDIEDYFRSKTLFLTDHLKSDFHFYVPAREVHLLKKLNEYKIETPKTLKDRNLSNLPPFFQTDFNQSDLEVALQLVEDIVGDDFKFDIDELTPPDGRFSIYEINGRLGIIDSAHTPDAFTNILGALKRNYTDKNIIVLFGCGGDRDPSKRAEMTKIACEFGDKVILTADNPRNEDINQIFEHMKQGLGGYKNFIIEPDRQLAVSNVVQSMTKSDLLVMLGKGPEDYQLIGKEKLKYSDFDAFVSACDHLDSL